LRGAILTFKRAKRLRREMTLPEVVLWECLRKGRLNSLQFRRQHPIGPYILDFFCPSARLVVEIDGEGHGHPDQERHDQARDRWLAVKGLRVLRIPASSVLDKEGLHGVIFDIAEAADA
jgi:very-short-patch-repair endonuclease